MSVYVLPPLPRPLQLCALCCIYIKIRSQTKQELNFEMLADRWPITFSVRHIRHKHTNITYTILPLHFIHKARINKSLKQLYEAVAIMCCDDSLWCEIFFLQRDFQAGRMKTWFFVSMCGFIRPFTHIVVFILLLFCGDFYVGSVMMVLWSKERGSDNALDLFYLLNVRKTLDKTTCENKLYIFMRFIEHIEQK